MEWYIAQSIALVAVFLVHAALSTAVMLYRRKQLASQERGVPAGVSVSFQNRSAHGVRAPAGDTYFRNSFTREEELQAMPHIEFSDRLTSKEMEQI
jgi:hypothetical protein